MKKITARKYASNIYPEITRIQVRIQTSCDPKDIFKKVQESCREERNFIINNFKKYFSELSYYESKVFVPHGSKSFQIFLEIIFKTRTRDEVNANAFIESICS